MLGLRSKLSRDKGEHYFVLFADVVGSTELYERKGDSVAKNLVDQALDQVRRAVTGHEGHVVKNLGDGVLAYFTSDSALNACLAIQSKELPGELQLRQGLHRGPLLLESDDIFGDTVNTAARLADKARAGELLASESAFGSSSPELRSRLRSIPPIRVKGKLRPLVVYSRFNSNEPGTDIHRTMAAVQFASKDTLAVGGMRLRSGEKECLVSPGSNIVLGRSPECDMVLDHREASRSHARIRSHEATFVIADTSTNGTYIVPEAGSPVYLQRQEQAIFGRGRIYLGTSPDSPQACFVSYEVT